MAFEAPLRAHGELIVSESLPPPGYETFLFVFRPFACRPKEVRLTPLSPLRAHTHFGN